MAKSGISRKLLLATIFLIPFYFFRFQVLGIPTNIFEVGVLVSLLATLFFVNSIKTNIKDWILTILLLAVSLLAAGFSTDKTAALGIFKGWFFIPIIFGWLVYKNFDKTNIRLIALPLYIGLLLVSVWAILQKIGVISTLFYQAGDASFNIYTTEGRVFGPFDSPNFLAMYLAPVAIISFLLIESLKGRAHRPIYALTFLLPILALYFTGSRAGFITFILSVLIYLNYRFVNLQKTKMRKPFLGMLFAVLFILINLGYLFFASTYYKPESGSSDSYRVEIYKYSEELIKSHPIKGIGLGDFQSKVDEASKDNRFFQYYGMPYALHPHNLFMALWLNLGLAGLALFILALVEMFKNLFFNDSKYKSYFIAAGIAVLVHGLFDTTYLKNDLSAIFWLIFAASLTLRQDEAK